MEVVQLASKLDPRHKFGGQDKNETWWRFAWESIDAVVGWFAWRKVPGATEYLCIGPILESEILKILKTIPNKLSEDDLLDLELWLNRGGLEEYAPNPKGFEGWQSPQIKENNEIS